MNNTVGLPDDFDSIPLRMSYELRSYEHVVPNGKPNLTTQVIEAFRKGVSQVLVPFDTVHGTSKTRSWNNPQCAASVRFNAEKIFGITLEPKETAKRLIYDLKGQIASGKRNGIVGDSISGVISEGYTSLILYMNSPKRPKSGHMAKAFKKFDGEVFVIDTEILFDGKKSGNPIPLTQYLNFLKQAGYSISEVIWLPTNRIVI